MLGSQEKDDRIIESSLRARRRVNCLELLIMAAFAGLALVMVVEGIYDDELYQLPEAGVLLIAGSYIYRGRLHRLRHEAPSDRSLLGDLEQALHTVDYEIKRQRGSILWCVAPLAIIMLIHMAFTYDGKPWWLWVVSFGALIAAGRSIERHQNKSQPKREELVSLRRKLTEEVS